MVKPLNFVNIFLKNKKEEVEAPVLLQANSIGRPCEGPLNTIF